MSKNIVCKGAICECQFGNAPDKLENVSTHKEFVNESGDGKKMIITTKDIGQPFEKKTFGQCKLQPTPGGYLPCVPNITQWQDFYDKVTLSNQGKIITEKSKAICAIAGSPCVKINFHGQQASPTSSHEESADENVHSQLNPMASPKNKPVAEIKHILISNQ